MIFPKAWLNLFNNFTVNTTSDWSHPYRYYGVKTIDAGEEAATQPTITVTDYEGDKVKVKTVPPLHRSRTDSIISYSNPGNNPR